MIPDVAPAVGFTVTASRSNPARIRPTTTRSPDSMQTEPSLAAPTVLGSPSLVEQLSTAIAAVGDLSAPSNTKWRRVNALLATGFGLPEKKVKTYYASELKQVSVRVTQAGVARDRPVLGLLLVGGDAAVERYVSTLRTYVKDPHPFEVILVGRWSAGELSLGDAVVKEGSRFKGLVVEALPGLAVVEVAGATVTVSASPAARESTASDEIMYDAEQFSLETGVSASRAQAWCETLRRKGQLILQGPPGTGKTHIASRLAKLVSSTTGGFTETVVFHSSYSYADFVAGLAPQVDEHGRLSYERVAGKLLQFAEAAQKRSADALCVLLIDEINRADLSSVFGELMFALEYRGEPVTLAHGPGTGVFMMPSNVLIIGTMNTADRSVASFDHALRRRFAFIRLEPDYAVVESQLSAAGLDPAPLVNLLREVNEQIKDPNYFLGTSFFISAGTELPSLFDDIWSTEVYPYLEELFRGRDDLLQRFVTAAVRSRHLSSWYQDAGANE